MTLPKTVLSFLYHGMIPPFQEEMHADFDTAFKRFNVTSPVIQQACRDADDAAFRLRKDPTSAEAGVALAAASQVIFDNLAPVLALEVAQGVSAPEQPIDGSGLTRGVLPDVYRLMYSRAFRDSSPEAPTRDVQTEWEALKAALAAGSGVFATLYAQATTLCAAMRFETNQSTWTMWW